MGNSPQKVMTNYREFVGEKEGQEWFGILPNQPTNVISVACRESSN